jgi:hypothetical protein
MLEYSTKIDDSISCQRSRIFHSRLLEYANVLLIPCHPTSALHDSNVFLLLGQPCSTFTLPLLSCFTGADKEECTYAKANLIVGFIVESQLIVMVSFAGDRILVMRAPGLSSRHGG